MRLVLAHFALSIRACSIASASAANARVSIGDGGLNWREFAITASDSNSDDLMDALSVVLDTLIVDAAH